MRLSLTRSAAIAPMVALALLVAACSGGGDADDASPAATEKADKADKDKGDSAADDPTTEPTEDTSQGDDAQGASEGAGCLEGDWVADVADQLAALQDQMAASGVEATIDITGDTVTTFSGGTTTTTYNNQVMDIGIAMEGQAIRTVTTMNGSVTGTYTATDTDVTMTVTDASGLEIAMDTYMGDQKVDTGDTGLDDTMRESMETSSNVAYTCSGDTLTITMPNAGLGAAVATVMHRR